MKRIALGFLVMIYACMNGFLAVSSADEKHVILEGPSQMKFQGASSRSVVLIGASYAGGWPIDKHMAGWRVINKGVAGQQSIEMLERFERDVLSNKPDAVIIWGFINDVFRSDRSQISQVLERTRQNMLTMVAAAKNAGITPILATEVTIRPKDSWAESIGTLIGHILGKSSYQDYINERVMETNIWIRETAVREGIVLFDFETVLADRFGVRRKEFAQPDGSHISLRGYEALVGYTQGQLNGMHVTDK